MLFVLIIMLAEASTVTRMMTYVFETIQILVSFTADLTFVRLLLLHAEGSRVRS